ncbi:phenylacetate--CoA ligase family protein [Clostridium sp. AF19-22AC]|jgi:phenylacetate-coenzyme A ligase PaaK-like adenylate-forming protein|uniref:Phenylacetate-coenzyme A ligase n=1 Tax=Faecalicatena orotica TaxID=1544 RepID=A0A2Y9BK71_9FIRM|nr:MULTISPECIES: phenylacetate--CoA ligase [Clostridia]PWJ23186.1 phenylacetate-CoA ligase [Faecalicatena orotica]RHR29485.1 phenylacetate--CoA ligase family protein [Clostridium sp. AF19-22AC]SSA57923.1 phenylacetate-CoA ligase [Faecalicatena orotica]
MAAVKLENWVERIRDPKIECMSSDEMAALQSRRLVDVVNRVYNNVDFYHKKMKDLGVEPGDIKGIEDIGKLPFTTKEDLRDNYPFGLLAIPKKDVVRVQGTSGTTGKLTLASYSQKDVDVWGECVARCLTMAGLTDEDIIHVCYGYGLFTGGMGLDYGAKALGATAIPMSAGNTKRQMMCMEDFGSTAFACTPSYALHLAESLEEAGVVDRLKLKAGIHGAEPWTVEMRKKIESILNINCFDIYGLCEISGPGVAQDCIHHAGLHINVDYFYPEVLNPSTYEACADGETGELVFTTLAKEAMPLLRYRTKDLTSIDHSTCACGRTTPRISKFTGRTDDMKVIRGVNVFPTQVETALLGMGGAVAPHYLMIVDREDNLDVLTVMVEVDESMFSDEIRKLDALKNKIGAVLKQALGVSARVKLVEPKTIQRSEGKAVRVIDNRNLQ